jgi:hypothetical protein
MMSNGADGAIGYPLQRNKTNVRVCVGVGWGGVLGLSSLKNTPLRQSLRFVEGDAYRSIDIPVSATKIWF